MRYQKLLKKDPLKQRIDERIHELRKENPNLTLREIASRIEKEFKVKISWGTIQRKIFPSAKDKERSLKCRRDLQSKLRPYGIKILQIYKANEDKKDEEIVELISKETQYIVSSRRYKTIVRYCRERNVKQLCSYLGISRPEIRQELNVPYKIRKGRKGILRKVYKCLVNEFNGVATYKELENKLGFDPSSILYILKRGKIQRVKCIRPGFTSIREGLVVWYVPEKEEEANRRAKEISSEKLPLSFRRVIKYYFRFPNQKEAEKIIPFLQEYYKKERIFYPDDLIEASDCKLPPGGLNGMLNYYAKKMKSLSVYKNYYSFSKENLDYLKQVLDLFNVRL